MEPNGALLWIPDDFQICDQIDRTRRGSFQRKPPSRAAPLGPASVPGIDAGFGGLNTQNPVARVQ